MSRSPVTWTTALARSLLRVKGGRTPTVLLQVPLAWLLFVVWLTSMVSTGTSEAPALTTAAFILTLTLLVLGLALPWRLLPRHSSLVIPVLDFAAITMTVMSAPGYGHGLSLLVVFPVVWLAASGLRGRWTFALVAIGCALVTLPAWLRHPPVNPSQTVLAVLLPLGITILTLGVHAAMAHQREQARLLEEQRLATERVTEQSRRTEELLRAGLAAIDVGILAIDAHGQPMTLNAELERLLTVAAPTDPAPWSDLAASEAGLSIHGSDRWTPVPVTRRPVARALAGEDFSHQLLWLGTGEHQRAVSVTARAVRDGTIRRGAVLAFTDVTDLLEVLADRDHLLSTVTHDLRSPISAILGRADLALERGELPDRTERDLVAIVHSAELMQSIVQDLLHSSSGTPSPRPLPTDLAELVQETVAAAEHAAADAEVDVSVEIPTRLPALVDPIRMRRVLDNLLVNAIKYSPVGGVVTVRARMMEDEAFVEFEDCGRGMTEAEARNAFQLFYRADSARHSPVPGLGLGLYICKSIVEAHGGTITCRSRPNQGTTFTLRLPGAAANREDARHQPGARRPTSDRSPFLPAR